MYFLKRLLKIVPPNLYKRCVLIVVIMFLGALLDGIGVGAILPLISAMGNSDYLVTHPFIAEIADGFGVYTHQSFLIFWSICLVGVYLVKNVYIAWAVKFQLAFLTKAQEEYASLLMERYLNKPYLYHVKRNSAYFIRNISNGPIITFSRIFLSVFTILSEICTIFCIWIMLAIADITTALSMLFMLIILALVITKLFKNKISQQGKIQNQFMMEYMKWIQQGFGAIKDIKVMHKQGYFLGKFKQAYHCYAQADLVYGFISQLPRLMIETLVVGLLLFYVIVKMMLGADPLEIVSLLGVFTLASFRLMPSAGRILSSINTIKYHMANYNDIYGELLEIRDKIYRINEGKCVCGNSVVLPFNNKINICNLKFRYESNQDYVLKDVTFSIPKGAFVGIIGESGAGKSTFIDIFMGLIVPEDGGIFIDGIDIQKDITAWRNLIAYVPQNIYLVDGTILENIALGTDEEKIDKAEIQRVLEMAQLDGFIDSLPDGLETRVGERGVMISGGQRQRIGIARALYRKPHILVLDEATSALDNETEECVTNTILNLKGFITIISIAHRVSTLEQCDFKVKFSNGVAKIVSR